MALIDVCPLAELPPGARHRLTHDLVDIVVFNCDGEVLAMEDRCSHDDGDLGDGKLDPAACTVACPRHGAQFDLRTGRPLTLPAYEPVETFPVTVSEGVIRVEVE